MPAQGLDLFATALCFSFICAGIYYVNLVERSLDPPNTPRWQRYLTGVLICICALWPVVKTGLADPAPNHPPLLEALPLD